MEIIQGSSAPPSDPWSLSDAESWYKKIKIRNRLRGRPALSGGRPSFESLSRGMSLSRCGPRGLAPGLAASLRKRRAHILRTLLPHVNDFFKILARFFSITFTDLYFAWSEVSSFAGLLQEYVVSRSLCVRNGFVRTVSPGIRDALAQLPLLPWCV